MSETTEPSPRPEVHWTVQKLEAGTWKTLFEDDAWRAQEKDPGDPLVNTQALMVAIMNLQARRFAFRFKAAHAAMAALMHGAEGVKIDRHPPLQ